MEIKLFVLSVLTIFWLLDVGVGEVEYRTPFSTIGSVVCETVELTKIESDVNLIIEFVVACGASAGSTPKSKLIFFVVLFSFILNIGLLSVA